MLGRDISVLCSYQSYCGQNILRVVHRHSGDECFSQRFSLGGIPEVYSDCSPGGIRGKGEELDGS